MNRTSIDRIIMNYYNYYILYLFYKTTVCLHIMLGTKQVHHTKHIAIVVLIHIQHYS